MTTITKLPVDKPASNKVAPNKVAPRRASPERDALQRVAPTKVAPSRIDLKAKAYRSSLRIVRDVPVIWLTAPYGSFGTARGQMLADTVAEYFEGCEVRAIEDFTPPGFRTLRMLVPLSSGLVIFGEPDGTIGGRLILELLLVAETRLPIAVIGEDLVLRWLGSIKLVNPPPPKRYMGIAVLVPGGQVMPEEFLGTAEHSLEVTDVHEEVG